MCTRRLETGGVEGRCGPLPGGVPLLRVDVANPTYGQPDIFSGRNVMNRKHLLIGLLVSCAIILGSGPAGAATLPQGHHARHGSGGGHRQHHRP